MTNTRHNPESLAPLAQEKEMDFEKYKANAAGDFPSVVVNHEGTWQTLKLMAEPRVVRGAVIAEVEIPATASTPARTETLTLDYAPQVVEFEEGQQIEDQRIVSTRVRKDGRVEFDLYDDVSDVETRGVPQEMLSTWKKTLELEDRVNHLGTQIAAVVHSSTEALRQKQLDASKIITTIKAELGAPSDMQDLGKRALNQKLKQLETAYEQAETAVKELRTEIAAIAPDTRGLKNYTHFEHLTDAERAERKTLVERVQKEIVERTKEIKDDAKEKEEAALEKKVKKELKRIEAEARAEDTAEETAYNTFAAEVSAAHANWGRLSVPDQKAFWDARTKEGKRLAGFTNNRSQPQLLPPYSSVYDQKVTEKSKNLSKIKLEDREKTKFEKMRQNAEQRAYFEIITALQGVREYNSQDLVQELEAKRQAVARAALTGDIGNYPLMDYTHVPPVQMIDAAGAPIEVRDYNPTGDELSTRNKKNIEFFKDILTQWSKAEKTAIPAGAESFDFNLESADVDARLAAVLAAIPKQANGAPVPAYQAIFDSINHPTTGLKPTFEEIKNHYNTIDDAANYVIATPPTVVGSPLHNFFSEPTRENLTLLRRSAVDDANLSLQNAEEQITALKNQEAFTKAETEYNKHEADEIKRKQNEIKDYEGDSLNLSAEHLKPLLAGKHAEVSVIMGKLYQQADFKYSSSGELEFEKTTLTNEIIEDFKNLFDGTSLNFTDPAVEALMHRIWPEAGVKDFEKFKTLWKEKLAGEVAKSFKVLAEETLAKKTAEKMQGFRAGLARAGKMKGALALRIAMTVGFVGAGIATGGLAAGALGIAGAAGAAVGGATGGAVRGWLNKKVFGKMFDKSSESANKELLGEKKDEIIAELLDENYSANWDTKDEGLEQFSTVLAQSIREFNEQVQNKLGPVDGEDSAAKTAREQKIQALIASGDLDELLASFSINERHVYLDTLAALEQQHPNEKQKFDLARAIFIMRDRGANMHTRALNEGNIDPIVVSTLDRMVSSYSGKRGIGAAALSGGIIAGVFASHEYLDNIFTGVEGSTLARGTLGGIMGAVQGYRFMEGVRQQQEREEAKAQLFTRMSKIRSAVISVHSGGSSLPLVSSIREEMIALKRLLHGSATPYETGAVVTIQKSGAKPAAYADKMLIKQIQGLVFEAEDLGLWVEKIEERRNLGAALDLMKKNSEEIEKNAKDKTRDSVWYKFKKNVLWRGGGIIGGAAIGAASAILIGKHVVPQVREGAHWVGEKLHIVDPMPHDTIDLGEEKFEVPESRGANFKVIPDYANPDYVDPSTSHGPDVIPGPTLSPEDAKALADLEGMHWGPDQTAGKGVLHFDDTLLNSNKQVHDFILERERAMYAASSDPRIQGHANWSDRDIIHAWKVRIGEIDGKIVGPWKNGMHAGMYEEGVTYKPYLRPDGTVGISGDPEHWEKGLFKFGAPKVEAPPLVPEPEAPVVPAHQDINVKNFYENIYEHAARGQEIHVGADVTASMEHVGGIPRDAVATENISSNPDLHTYLARVKTGGEYKSFIYVSDADGNFYRTPYEKFFNSIPSVPRVTHGGGESTAFSQNNQENALDRQEALEAQRHQSFEKNVSLLANDVNIKHNMFTRGVLQLKGAEGKQALNTFINDYVSSHPDTDFRDSDSHDEFLNAWRQEARKLLFPLQSEMTPEPRSPAPFAQAEAPAAPVANAAEAISSANIASAKNLAVLGELDGKGRHLSIWDKTFDKPRDVALPEKWHPTVGDEGKITIPGADGEEMKGTIEWKNIKGRIEPVFNVGPGEKYLLKDLIQDINKANPLPEPGDIAVRDAA